MDAMLAEIQSNSSRSIALFQSACPNLVDLIESDRFDLPFFRLRKTLKDNEEQLASILRQCFSRATTLSSQLRLLDVFHGVYQRDVVQRALRNEEGRIIDGLREEFRAVNQLIPMWNSNHRHWPPLARRSLHLYGLKQRIDQSINQFSSLCPKIIHSDLGWEIREEYRKIKENIFR